MLFQIGGYNWLHQGNQIEVIGDTMTSKLFTKFSCPILSTLPKTVNYNYRMLEQNGSLKVTESNLLIFLWKVWRCMIFSRLRSLVTVATEPYLRSVQSPGQCCALQPWKVCLLCSVQQKRISQHKPLVVAYPPWSFIYLVAECEIAKVLQEQ